MRKAIIITAAAAVFATAFLVCQPSDEEIAIVPNPVSIEYSGKGVRMERDTRRPEMEQVIDSTLSPEEYILDATGASGDRVIITAGSNAGLWWGEQTLREILSQSGRRIPGVMICDKPSFEYRGVHLDCCRHFFPVEDVKRFIDIANLHKVNVFHWHLTDDQGWRAEIKKYPRLTEVGAYRGESHYGSFYTQEDMKEVVSYAAERHMTVIPEIEMPGHALAALTAYPELGCTGEGYEVTEEWGVFDDVFCIGKEETFSFLEDVLDEICDIFPSEYIHIGGDEAPRTRWKECPDCRRRMKEEGLKSADQLQSYLVRRMEQYLNSKGRRIIGWDEILLGGVTSTATVMSWQGTKGGIEAARLGNDVIMSPYTYFYLDYYQTKDHTQEPEGTTYETYLPLEKCYSFDPYDKLKPEQTSHIKGIQANTWTEHMYDIEDVEHMVLPRLAAMAEVSWSTSRRTSYEDFVERCRKALLPLYESAGYNYADYAFRNPPVE